MVDNLFTTPCKYPAANKSPAPVKSFIFKFFLASHSITSFCLTLMAPFSPLVITTFLLISLQNDITSSNEFDRLRIIFLVH